MVGAAPPLPVAPVLARLQPDFGWGGDLQVQGSLQLRTRPQLQVDAVLERSQGDLHVTEDLGIQRLGLSELRLGLIGSPGVWHFSHALAGSQSAQRRRQPLAAMRDSSVCDVVMSGYSTAQNARACGAGVSVVQQASVSATLPAGFRCPRQASRQAPIPGP